MAQNNDITRSFTRYTRVDFAALRFHLNNISPDFISDRLYDENTLQERGIKSANDLGKWLNALKRHLIDLAVKQNPLLAQSLEEANKSNRWFKAAMQYLVDLGEKNFSYPTLSDPLSQWFKKKVASIFRDEEIYTVSDLKALIERRGRGWYRSFIRIGAGKAAAIERWLESHSEHLGSIKWPRELAHKEATYELSPESTPWVPLENIRGVIVDARALDGSAGINRNQAFCLISARNDLEAIQAYLYKYRDQLPTYRAYRKELERFLLWCVCSRQVALSSVLVDDCEAYKTFLSNIPDSWCVPRVSRSSSRWRPFASQLSKESQRYAIQTIRGCFEWLVGIRYLSGNPWVAVADPVIERREIPLQIHRALPQDIWEELVKAGGWLDQACDTAQELAQVEAETLNQCVDSTHIAHCVGSTHQAPHISAHPKSKIITAAQYRLARAAIFLIGFSGIRREEAAGATREHLRPVQLPGNKSENLNLWELAILGKRSKWRTVYVPKRALDALAAHWEDRQLDLFGCVDSTQTAHLLAPVVIPSTPSALKKHGKMSSPDHIGCVEPTHASRSSRGFAPDALYLMVRNVLNRLAKSSTLDLDDDARNLIRNLAPHALRHTFATGAAAHEMPVDVLQSLLGHTSVQTTSIYVQAEKVRSVKEIQKLFSLANVSG